MSNKIMPGGVQPQYLKDEELRKARIKELENKRKETNSAVRRELMELNALKMNSNTHIGTIKKEGAVMNEVTQKIFTELKENQEEIKSKQRQKQEMLEKIHQAFKEGISDICEIKRTVHNQSGGDFQKQFDKVENKLDKLMENFIEVRIQTNGGQAEMIKGYMSKLDDKIERANDDIIDMKSMLAELVGHFKMYSIGSYINHNANPPVIPQYLRDSAQPVIINNVPQHERKEISMQPSALHHQSPPSPPLQHYNQASTPQPVSITKDSGPDPMDVMLKDIAQSLKAVKDDLE
ncbi:MAG: hypothetical protein FWE01_01525 [Firmicutes bacterium]|nr:hypothetical protein [Bacillota bacterium]